MKETWESVRALEALLEGDGCQNCFSTLKSFLPPASQLCHDQNLHESPDVNITAWDFGSAEENVSTIATRAINPHGIFAAVGGGAVKSDFTALIAVSGVGGPCRLVPSAFEALRDLGKGEWKESKHEKSRLGKHC